MQRTELTFRLVELLRHQRGFGVMNNSLAFVKSGRGVRFRCTTAIGGFPRFGGAVGSASGVVSLGDSEPALVHISFGGGPHWGA